MSDYVLFHMWGPFRQSLIDRHLFYVGQAHKRLLSQFDDMEAEADKSAEEWLETNSDRFDPERHDPSAFYEAAHDAAIEFYGLLSDMRDQTRLSVVAGMFQEWDKQLRNWLAREMRHWHHGESAKLKVWSVDFGQIADLLESLGWKIRSTPYFRTLDACRLVVNVYKHGEGKSLDELKQNYPEYLGGPFGGADTDFSGMKYTDHTHLNVSDDQFRAFAAAIVACWKDVPERVFESMITDVPDWFGKAILRDRDERTRR
jgi:hypothetical protein